MKAGRHRRELLVVVLLVGAASFASILDHHQPLAGWLAVSYLRAIALAAVFSLSCLVSGHALLVRTLRRTLPLEEHLTLALALGVLAFFLTSVLFGVLGLYGRPFFVGGPLLLLALGWRDFTRFFSRARRHLSRLDARPRFGLLEAGVLGFGCVAVGLLWFTILTPQNASYDARWYHLPIAQQYVADGGIRRFSEGWVNGAFPQLASLLYAWAFSAPSSLFDRVEAAAHLELAVFFMTLVGITAVVRRIMNERAPLSWVTLFLFPGIFCYDSGLVLGADHVAALWAAPIFLVSLRFAATPSRGYAVLLGAMMGGAVSTKYTAAILLPLPLVLIVSRTWRDLRSCPPRAALAPGLTALATLLAVAAPHWLKNLVFYGDPWFPLLRRIFPAAPWCEAAEAPYRTWYALVRPELGLAALGEMLKALVTFSFVPHDWRQYHGTLPVFGSLFSLLTPAFLFFRSRPRLGWLVLGSYLGVGLWFFIHQFDRYLQALVPWMAAATFAALVLLFRRGGVVRVAVLLLVLLQVVWGAGVPFIPAHRTAGGSVQKLVLELLSGAGDAEARARLLGYPEWQALGRALPAGARVLLHEEEVAIGLDAAVVRDHPGDQGAFYWGEPGAASAPEVWRLLRAHGVTHLVWAQNLDHGTDTVAGGLVFFDFVTHHVTPLGVHGGFALAALPDHPPPAEPPGEVAYYPCDATPPFRPGLYQLAEMARSAGDRRPVAAPAPDVSFEQALDRARFLVFDPRCHGPLPAPTRERFELLAARGHAMLLERRTTP